MNEKKINIHCPVNTTSYGLHSSYTIKYLQKLGWDVRHLKIGNNCGSIQIPIANLVMNYPQIGFKVDTANACKENLSIHLVDTSKGLFTIAHDYWYSENNSLLLKDATIVDHIFTQPGKYKILHAITDAKGLYFIKI